MPSKTFDTAHLSVLEAFVMSRECGLEELRRSVDLTDPFCGAKCLAGVLLSRKQYSSSKGKGPKYMYIPAKVNDSIFKTMEMVMFRTQAFAQPAIYGALRVVTSMFIMQDITTSNIFQF